MLQDIHKIYYKSGFHTFFEILGISIEMPIFQVEGAKNLAISKFLIRNT